MKRSTINDIIVQSDEMIRSFGFPLPSFAYWKPDQFKANAASAQALVEAR